MSMGLSLLKTQFTNLCKSADFKFAVLKFTVKSVKAMHLQIYVNSLSLKFMDS